MLADDNCSSRPLAGARASPINYNMQRAICHSACTHDLKQDRTRVVMGCHHRPINGRLAAATEPNPRQCAARVEASAPALPRTRASNSLGYLLLNMILSHRPARAPHTRTHTLSKETKINRQGHVTPRTVAISCSEVATVWINCPTAGSSSLVWPENIPEGRSCSNAFR